MERRFWLRAWRSTESCSTLAVPLRRALEPICLAQEQCEEWDMSEQDALYTLTTAEKRCVGLLVKTTLIRNEKAYWS